MSDAAVNPLKAGLEDVVAPSDICFIDGHTGRLVYRGFDVDDLVEQSSFEEVTYLLWYGRLPTRKELNAHRLIRPRSDYTGLTDEKYVSLAQR